MLLNLRQKLVLLVRFPIGSLSLLIQECSAYNVMCFNNRKWQLLCIIKPVNAQNCLYYLEQPIFQNGMSTHSALVSWLAATIKIPELASSDLKDARVFIKLAAEIPDLEPIAFQQGLNVQQWQKNYINLKNVYESIERYYRNTLKSTLPSGLPSINILEIAKGEDEAGFTTLLTIFFIACIESESREKFITYILELEQSVQSELMTLIQQKNLKKLEQAEQTYSQSNEDKDMSKLDQMYFKIQSLQSQNESLSTELFNEAEQKKKLKQQIKKLQEENRKIRRELSQKILFIEQKQQQQQYEESTNKILSESNEQLIKDLKKQLIAQQRKHMEELSQMKEEIYTMKMQLDSAHQQISDLESQDLIASSSNRKIHHKDCVSQNEHKNMIHKLQLLLKNKEHKQTELDREIIRLKFEIEEKNRVLKQQEKEIEKMREKSENSKGEYLPAHTAHEIKVAVLEKVRDSLAIRLKEVNQASKMGKKEAVSG